MWTSQNLPVAVRVVRRERGLMISERDMELCPELGLPSASAPKCSGAVMGMPQLWQKIIFSGVLFYVVSGCVADV